MSPQERLVDSPVAEYVIEGRARKAVKGAAWSALNVTIPTALSATVFIVTSRYLSPQEFGIVALAVSVVMFASSIGPTAFGEALVQRQSVRQSHVDSVFWLAIVSSFVIYFLILALSSVFLYVFDTTISVELLAVIGLKVVFDFAAIVPNAIINRGMAFHLVAARTLIATVVSGTVGIALVVAGFGLWAIAFAQISSSIASCTAAYWGAAWVPGFRFQMSSLRELSHYGIFASANRLLQNMSLDQLLMGTLLGPSSLGLYNFATRMLQLLGGVVSGGLSPVTHVLLSSLQTRQDKVRDAFLMATFGCSIVSFPLFIGLALVARDAIPLVFGDAWTAAILPVQFFCVIGTMSGVGIIQAALITSQGKASWWFSYQLIRNVVTISTILTVYSYGVEAITFAMMIGTLVLWPITIRMTSRLIDVTAGRYFMQFLRPLAAAALMGVAIHYSRSVVENGSPLIRLVALVAVGGTAYALGLAVLCRKQIRNLVCIVRGSQGLSIHSRSENEPCKS